MLTDFIPLKRVGSTTYKQSLVKVFCHGTNTNLHLYLFCIQLNKAREQTTTWILTKHDDPLLRLENLGQKNRDKVYFCQMRSRLYLILHIFKILTSVWTSPWTHHMHGKIWWWMHHDVGIYIFPYRSKLIRVEEKKKEVLQKHKVSASVFGLVLVKYLEIRQS